MQIEIDNLKKENMELKKHGSKETWGGWDYGKGREGGGWVDDPWKQWKGRNETANGGDEWVSDGGE